MSTNSNTEKFFDNLDGEWLSTKEAARYLGVTPLALRLKVFRGQIQAHKLGSRLKFRIRDLRCALHPRRR